MKAKSMIDRLSLDHDRLLGMADGLRQIAKLADPIGEVMSMAKRPNGLILDICIQCSYLYPGLICIRTNFF